MIRGRRLIEGRLLRYSRKYGILFRVVTQQCFSLPKKETPRAQTKYKWSICTETDLFTKRMLILSYDPLLGDYSSIRFSETETNFRLSGNSRKNLMSL